MSTEGSAPGSPGSSVTWIVGLMNAWVSTGSVPGVSAVGVAIIAIAV